MNWYRGAAMTVGRALRWSLAVCLVATVASAVETVVAPSSPAEVRVLSLPGQPTVVTVQGAPESQVDDRTPGAHPPSDTQGAASVGETFSDEITFFVRGTPASRPAAIEVSDALVSTVRLFPEHGGTQVVVFVRQPVSYSITRPSASGAIAVTLRSRAVPRPPPAHPGEKRPPAPKPADGSDEQVAVDAAELSYDQQSNVLTARGNVALTRGTTTLRADEVRYDRTTSMAEAHGHVVVVDPEATIEGDAARIDLDDETGWIDQAQADMKQSPYRLNAGHIEKQGGPCYQVQDGIFTTCRCGGIERPSWSIASAHAEVTMGGVGVAKNATFRVLDTPVLYFPYLLFPANTDRQSGFLMPSVSYSNRRGFIYEQPYFWAIDKSSDLTLGLDLETAARIGGLAEYRYEWSKRSSGDFTGGYFNDSLGGNGEPLTRITAEPESSPENRWIVAGHHRTRFDGGQIYMDVLRLSDDNFLREIRSFNSNVRGDIQTRSTRSTRTRLGVLDTWEGGALQAEVTSYQDLIDPQRFALDRLPRIAAEHSIPLFGGLAVARLPGEAVDFQRSTGSDGLRLDLGPQVFVPFQMSRFLFGSVLGQVRETAYHLTDTEQVARVTRANGTIGFVRNDALPELDTNHTRELAQVEGRIGTEVAKVYSFPYLGLDRIRHSIEPEVQYLFVPPVGRDYGEQKVDCVFVTKPNGRVTKQCGKTLFTAPYLFDDVDAINRRDFISYGVTTRILGRIGAIPTVAPEPAELTERTAAAEGAALDEAAAEASDEDEDDQSNDVDLGLETIDPDTIPQGLPAAAVPPFGKSRAKPGQPIVTGASRELVRLSLLQGYDVSREISGSSHLSDVDGLVRVTPVDWLGFSYNNTVNVEQGKMLAQTVGVVLREPGWSPPPGRPSFQSASSIGISYRFVASALNQGLQVGSAEQRLFQNAAVEEIDGSLYLRVGDYVGFGFLGRYALTPTTDPNTGKTLGSRFLERDYFMRLTSPCACWAVEVGVSDRSDTGETTARVQLLLYGLGTFGQGQGRRGFAGLGGLQSLGLRRPTALGRDY